MRTTIQTANGAITIAPAGGCVHVTLKTILGSYELGRYTVEQAEQISMAIDEAVAELIVQDAEATWKKGGLI